jgi:hypothetical protein
MAEVTNTKDLKDPINIQAIIEFLEYEEAITKDKETANRITILLKLLGIWS